MAVIQEVVPQDKIEMLERKLKIPHSQAKVLYRWVVAQRRVDVVRNGATEDALREARHNMKNAFPGREERAQVQKEAMKLV